MKIVFKTANGALFPVEAASGSTLLEVALDNDVPGILGDCGGEMSCGTCHAYIEAEKVGEIPEPSDDERIMIEDGVIDPCSNSRLCCQVILTEALDGMVVSIPQQF